MSYPEPYANEEPSPNLGDAEEFSPGEIIEQLQNDLESQKVTVKRITTEMCRYAVRARRLKEKLIEIGAADLVAEVDAAEESDKRYEAEQERRRKEFRTDIYGIWGRPA